MPFVDGPWWRGHSGHEDGVVSEVVLVVDLGVRGEGEVDSVVVIEWNVECESDIKPSFSLDFDFCPAHTAVSISLYRSLFLFSSFILYLSLFCLLA